MATIRIYENHCVIDQEPDKGFLRALDNELSFKVLGAEHTRAFKGYYNKEGTRVQWDGMQRLLTDQLHFPVGLLTRVQEFYKSDDKAFETIDERPVRSPIKSVNILPILAKLGKNPYDYQIEAVDAASACDRGIIRVATGGGKTNIAALLTARLGKRTIIYVIGKDLLYQTHKFFGQVFGQKVGIIGDGNCEIHGLNIASVWTVGQAVGLAKAEIVTEGADDEAAIDPQKYKDIRDMMASAKVHVFDECHLAACSTIQEIAKSIKPEHIYGMSASPWRDDGADLLIESVLGRNVVDISASRLIDGGFLVKPIIKFVSVPPYPEKLKKSYPHIYKNYIVENPVRNALVVKGAEKLVEQGYQTLVLYNNVAHGNLLYEEISKCMPCILLSGKDSSDVREAAKAKLESGEINCIIASKIFDIGVDLPSLSGLIIASGGKSSVRALQRIGRVIRRYPGKKQAAVIDFYDHADFLKEHSFARYKIYSSEERFQVIWPK